MNLLEKPIRRRTGYRYDPLGGITNRIDNGVQMNTFNYNARSELLYALFGTNETAYAYDDIGNHNLYPANGLNQYLDSGIEYDLDGNMIRHGGFTFGWDAENRLVSANGGTTSITNAYDYKHRRVRKTVGSESHAFVYDGWNLLGETVNDVERTHYFWGLDLSDSLQGAGGVGGMLAVSQDGAMYYPIYDNNGNVTAYLDDSGNIVASYEYNAFGETIVQSGSLSASFSFRFSTKYYDAESRLYYYLMRFYHPPLRTWLNRDPIEEEGGLNLYGFCQNNSVDRYDAFGLYTIDDAKDSLKKQGLTPDKKGFLFESYSDTQIFDEWLRLEKANGSWWTKLPKCPGKICIRKDGTIKNPDSTIWRNPKRANSVVTKHHPGAAYEMRSNASAEGCGNQCTYNEAGKLITAIPAAGTVDLYSPSGVLIPVKHYLHDVDPSDLAVALGRIKDYYLVRPSW